VALTNVYTGTDLSNYSIVDQTTAIGTVTPKALTATLSANNKVYDQTTAANATIGSITGLVGNETVSALGVATFNDKNAGTGKTVTLNSVVLVDGDNGGVATNYSMATGFTTTANTRNTGAPRPSTNSEKRMSPVRLITRPRRDWPASSRWAVGSAGIVARGLKRCAAPGNDDVI
jgi:hypothetical protein